MSVSRETITRCHACGETGAQGVNSFSIGKDSLRVEFFTRSKEEWAEFKDLCRNCARKKLSLFANVAH